MKTSEGGFGGGIGAPPEVVQVAHPNSGHEPLPGPEPQEIWLLRQHVGDELDNVRAEIEGLRQQVLQLEGEKQEIIKACGQYQQAIVELQKVVYTQDQRTTALSQAVARNYRVEAARIAASCRQPAESVERMQKMTEMWLALFEAPTKEEPQRQEEPAFDSPLEPLPRMN